MGAVQPQASGLEHFSIRAVHQGAAGGGPAAPTGLGAYPQPPMTAPPKAAAQPAVQDSQAPSVEPGSLASFGIAAGAFVAAAPKAGGRTGEGALPAPRALTREAMLASASFATKADLRRFLLTPGPADAPLQCKVLRSRGGLLRGAPLYTLLVEQEGGRGGTFLLAARKRKGGPGGATYVLSVDQHDTSSHSASFVGKLSSNFLGTEFVFHDAGDKHAAGEAGGRCELGATMYQTNVLGSKGPRKMTVVLPKLDAAGQRPLAVSPRGEHDSLLGQYKAYSLSSCVVLRNKPPRWNQGLGAYCLNFGGRVTQASVKNFQLVSVDNMERTILQFGKVAKDAFTLDYCYPMTALQAFFISLSSMDSKLACE
ncbi:hypothetical protein COHA_001560 [Chlorella ohadii]|uniref:Tubby C-terminal domain-containing protein n=1 Tax=Chlorella ohadii TaxID=2649997 RepID=A0AAD5H9D5_9CHLO|nr:hypothetical protein COHA_001560 [Chlorella ohadii]